MSASGSVQPARTYVVVARSRASAIFAPDEELVITVPYDQGAPAQLTFRTRYSDKGFEAPVPDALWVEARGEATSLRDGAERFANTAREIAAIIAVSANASLGQVDVELAYDGTPGVAQREYFQSFLPERPLSVVPGRRVRKPETVALLRAVADHPDKRRIMRAIAQYDAALHNWSPGSELLCVAHLFMGIEALKPVALRRHLADAGLSREGLGAVWGFETGKRRPLDEFLEAEARRRILFEADEETHRIAKFVSDNFEHGFEDFGALRPPACQVVVATARYLRTAIIRLSGVGREVQDVLLGPSFAEPRGSLKLVKYLWGRLNSPTEALATEGQDYPICRWKSTVTRVFVNEEGKYSFAATENMTPALGEGVTLNPERYEVWDGSTIRQEPPPPVTKETP